jgi:hypothetical protein
MPDVTDHSAATVKQVPNYSGRCWRRFRHTPQLSGGVAAGALVGPPWSKRQLGVVFRETEPGGVSLYYEVRILAPWLLHLPHWPQPAAQVYPATGVRAGAFAVAYLLYVHIV